MRPTKTSSPILPRIDDCEWTPSVQHLFWRHFRSRQALQIVMERHKIDPKLLDPLFNHTIVHSLDHDASSGWLMLRFSLHPWGTKCSMYQAFNTSMFRILITLPNLNPLAPNTIRSINKPFYQDLYRELRKIDRKMADAVTASVMF
ncbi:hypothetical protein Bbelb_359830 [Branchiostoma belcheri]|nr:hypothetical protein Bbelb_359830 [Branchiostoma belcheri]